MIGQGLTFGEFYDMYMSCKEMLEKHPGSFPKIESNNAILGRNHSITAISAS
ncbi:hypothetical protein N39L_17860 [Limnospira platensis NIES-39]|uniref:Uncharacterized protein n=1 Tax=Limnospira platensis NIES-46 TaxID=1236695 RepID=A0A5M3T0S4_LIMPL|nr:hypothetical protein NIES39_D02920 [Arthrospira platensis NIES-39]BDT12063.1 hypothetical protein N39L_17860 [Arthrospira platensis NIES-39]GCE93223.1 hypothetical protein NIES46_12720 [Arthrospira platensis NIES-46]